MITRDKLEQRIAALEMAEKQRRDIPAMQRGRLCFFQRRQVQAGNGNSGQALPSPCTFDLRQYLHHV